MKYEEVYFQAYDSFRAAQQGLARYLTFYNQQRLHRARDGITPDTMYCDNLTTRLTAACQNTARLQLRNGTFCPNKWGHRCCPTK